MRCYECDNDPCRCNGDPVLDTENKRVLEIVDACFHRYASSYRNDAKKYAMELMNSKPNT